MKDCPDGYSIYRYKVNGREVELLFRNGYTLLSPLERATICNGMGADSGLSRLVPNTIWGLDVSEIANGHDFDYYLGGCEWDRETADDVFYQNLLEVIDAYGGLFAWFRRMRAKTYYRAVRLAGNRHYNYGKEEMV